MADIIDFNDAAPQDMGPRADRVPILRQRLNSNAASFVRWIFPAAIVRNGEARVGDLHGSPGSSLQISLAGEKCGIWVDHADDSARGGDLIALYAAAEGLDLKIDFPRILDELEAWAGISLKPKPRSQKQVQREAQKDQPHPEISPLGPPTGTWHYFDEESRIVATVYRHDLPNGGKTYRPWDAKTSKYTMPAIRPLYNLPGILHAEPIVLVEGEKCADVLIGLGYAATTAMGGAHAPVEKTDWSAIKGKSIILWPDADTPGQKWTRTVSGYLQQFGCKLSVVEIPASAPDGWDAADAIRDGADIAAIVATASKPAQPFRFKLLTLSELSGMQAPEWIVDNYLPEYGFSVAYGPSGSFKSFIVLDMALHIAHGLPWCGKPTKKRGVVYVAGEGGFGMLKRVLAWHQSHDLPLADNFLLLPSAVDFIDPNADITHLIQAIEAFRHLDIGLIPVDTLARTFIGGDENSAKDMGAFIANCDRLKDRFRCMVMAVHHSGKDEDRGARGSNSLRGAVETELRIKRIGTSNRVTIECKKQKDAEEAEPVYMDAVKIEIALSNGELVESAVMRPLTSPIKEKTYIGPTECLVVKLLEDEKTGLTFMDVVRKTNKPKSSIRDALKSLQECGLMVKIDGLYWLSLQVSPHEQD